MGLLWVLVGLFSFSLEAKTFKVATLAPEGSTWANNLQLMAAAIERQTQGRVGFKLYYGGVAGDEMDVLRKIRIGQMQGGVFTGMGLGEVFSDIRVLEVPFNFKHDGAAARKALTALAPFFAQGLAQNGFKSLGFFEMGKVYLVSSKKITSLQELRGIKVWVWDGDDLASAFAREMKVVATPLSLPDVLTGLSTGMVDAAYATPMGILSLQWNSKVKYLVNFPVAYAIGALLVSLKEWRQLTASDRRVVEKITTSNMQRNSAETIAENVRAMRAMQAMGVKFVEFPNSDLALANQVSRRLWGQLREAKMFSPQVVELFKRTRQ